MGKQWDNRKESGLEGIVARCRQILRRGQGQGQGVSAGLSLR